MDDIDFFNRSSYGRKRRKHDVQFSSGSEDEGRPKSPRRGAGKKTGKIAKTPEYDIAESKPAKESQSKSNAASVADGKDARPSVDAAKDPIALPPPPVLSEAALRQAREIIEQAYKTKTIQTIRSDDDFHVPIVDDELSMRVRAKKAPKFEDQTVFGIVIKSGLDQQLEKNILVFNIRASQQLRLVKRAFCQANGLDYAQGEFVLTWRGAFVYDFATPKGLGMTDKSVVILMTQKGFEEAQRKNEVPLGEVIPAEQGAKLDKAWKRIILRDGRKNEFKTEVTANTRVSALVEKWREKMSLSKTSKLALYYEGEKLSESATMAIADLDFNDEAEEYIDVRSG